VVEQKKGIPEEARQGRPATPASIMGFAIDILDHYSKRIGVRQVELRGAKGRNWRIR